MRRHRYSCSQRDVISRCRLGRSRTTAFRPYSKARRVCLLCISITDLSHLIARSFECIHRFLVKLVKVHFWKRYLRRYEISRDLSDCDSSLRDALALFTVSSESLQWKESCYSQHHRFRFKSAYLNKLRTRRNTGRRKPRRSLKRLRMGVCHPPPLTRIYHLNTLGRRKLTQRPWRILQPPKMP